MKKLLYGFIVLTALMLGATAGYADRWGEGSAMEWIVKSSAYTARGGDNILCDTSGDAVTVTLPASPSAGDTVRIFDTKSYFDTNNLTVGRNGNKIRGAASNLTVSTENALIVLVYTDSTTGWQYILEPSSGSGSGDVTTVGDCASGDCLDGSSDGGTYISLYDGDSNYTKIMAGNSSADLTFTFPTAYAAGNNYLVNASTAGVLGYTDPATFQGADADLGVIAGLSPAEGKIIIADSDPKWSLSAFKVPAPSTSGNIMKSDGTNWTSSNSLSIATLDMTSSTSSIPCPVGTAAAPTDEGKMYWNSTNDALTVGTGAAAKVFIGEGAATGGLLFGDSTPDAAGEVGYDSGKFGFYGANSEDIYINVGSAANTVTVGTNTGVTDLSLGAINLLTTGTIAGRVPIGSDITGNISLNTTDLIGKVYFVTAACTITLDKVSDVGYGAVVGFYVRDASETCTIEVDDADKIKLYGTALAAGNTIDSPGAAGNYIFLMSVTDADGSGTDGWVTFGGSGTWKDGGAT